jgi:hypothetical protein
MRFGVIDGLLATRRRVVQPVRSSAPSALDPLGYPFLGLAGSA